MNGFVALKQSDGYQVINVDEITSVSEVTEEDGVSYTTVSIGSTTFYYTEYTREKLVSSFTRAIRVERDSLKPKFDRTDIFFTFETKDKNVSVKIDNVLYLDETDIEGEYFVEIRTKNGDTYTVNNENLDSLIDKLQRTLCIIEPDIKE